MSLKKNNLAQLLLHHCQTLGSLVVFRRRILALRNMLKSAINYLMQILGYQAYGKDPFVRLSSVSDKV